MTVEELNAAPPELLQEPLARCCGSKAWVQKMIARRPFADLQALFTSANKAWWSLEREDWLEAFSQHPKIGEKRSDRWSSEEQSGMQQADLDTSAAIENLNRAYYEKFGYIFIVCATGMSGAQMHAQLLRRLDSPPEAEIRIAAYEQARITKLRLEKLFAPRNGISTHVLNTAAGCPVPGIPVRLFHREQEIGSGVTNADGRCPALLLPDAKLEPGIYRITFDIASRMPDCFYPMVNITFKIVDAEAHYHIPLLLSPFGYTTYRGS